MKITDWQAIWASLDSRNQVIPWSSFLSLEGFLMLAKPRILVILRGPFINESLGPGHQRTSMLLATHLDPARPPIDPCQFCYGGCYISINHPTAWSWPIKFGGKGPIGNLFFTDMPLLPLCKFTPAVTHGTSLELCNIENANTAQEFQERRGWNAVKSLLSKLPTFWPEFGQIGILWYLLLAQTTSLCNGYMNIWHNFIAYQQISSL